MEPKILSEKGDLPEHFARTFSLVMPFSHESEHTKLMTLLIINLPLAVFYWQSLSCKVIDKSQGDLNSSNSNYFPLCRLPGRFLLHDYFSKFRVTFHLDFLRANLAAPIISYPDLGALASEAA